MYKANRNLWKLCFSHHKALDSIVKNCPQFLELGCSLYDQWHDFSLNSLLFKKTKTNTFALILYDLKIYSTMLFLLYCLYFYEYAPIPVADPGFGQGGAPAVVRPNLADVVKWAYLGMRSGARLRAPRSFWGFHG